MSTPVATIADALFAFIMSLLRDPEAVEQFNADPHTALTKHGLDDACAADVRAVKPVVVDHPSVTARVGQSQQQHPPTGTPFNADPDPSDEVVREITRIVNQFTSIDARTTIVDQSVNQNIWSGGGDVTQIFDQDSVVASGDGSVAAGDDATLVDSDVDITVGDVSVGNTTNDGSFNTDSSDNSTTDGSFNNTDIDNSSVTGADDADDADAALTTADEPSEDEVSDAAAVAGAAVTAAVDAAADAIDAVPPVEAPAAPPAELLSADLTDTDVTYESDAASVVLEEPMVEEPAEEQ